MTAKQLAKKIISLMGQRAERESIFLTPYPQWEINVMTICDLLIELKLTTPVKINAQLDAEHAKKKKKGRRS